MKKTRSIHVGNAFYFFHKLINHVVKSSDSNFRAKTESNVHFADTFFVALNETKAYSNGHSTTQQVTHAYNAIHCAKLGVWRVTLKIE